MYEIIKADSPSVIAELYDYLKDKQKSGVDINVKQIGDFINFYMIHGRSYIAKYDNKPVGGMCMYATNKHVFLAHGYIDEEHRKTMLFRDLYKLASKYSKDMNKKMFVLLNNYDYSSYKDVFKSKKTVKGGVEVHQLDMERF